MSFPLNPVDGEGYINALGTRYVYNATDNKWVIQSKNIGVTGAQGYTGVKGADYGVTGAINMTASYVFESAPTGVLGYIKMPFNYQINDFTFVANETGSMNLTVSKSNYSAHPAYTAMHGETGPRLSGQIKYFESSLVGKWSSPTGVAGDIIKITVDSNDTIKSFLISLGYSRT